MPIHLLLAVLHLRIFLDTLGAAGMRRASRGAEERTWARGHSKTRSHSKQKRQDAQADDEDITRTRYEVRAEEEVRDNGRTGGPARSSGSTGCSSHGNGPVLECLSAGAGPERVRCLLSGSSPDLRSSITSAPRLPREKHGERQAKARAKRGLGRCRTKKYGNSQSLEFAGPHGLAVSVFFSSSPFSR